MIKYSRDILTERERLIETQKDELKRSLQEMGFDTSGNGVIATSDMALEEEEFELVDGFLREGYTLDDAKKKAQEWMAIMNSI